MVGVAPEMDLGKLRGLSVVPKVLLPEMGVEATLFTPNAVNKILIIT